jgi:hypothetical protein
VTAEPIEQHDETAALVPAAQPGTLLGTRCDVPRDLDQMLRLAEIVSRANLLPDHLRGKESNVVAIMIAARALDLPLWQGIQELHMVDGKIGMSANLMRALWLRAGHGFRVVERTGERAVVEITRKGCDPYEVAYELQDAVDAGLCQLKDGKPWARSSKGNPLNWEKYTKNMLIARATSTGLREVGSDILLGFYTPDELSEGAVSPELEVRIEPALTAEDIEAARKADAEHWAQACSEIAATETKEALRDLWHRFNKVDLLDLPYQPEGGATLRQKIDARLAELEASAGEVQADGDRDPDDERPVEDVELPLGEVECSNCDGTGKVEDLFCGSCNGTGGAA